MNLTYIGIFLEGLLSFLSPCVLPLLPLYMSYLAGEDKTVDENGNVKFKTVKVFISTIFFVLGICFTLALLVASLNYIKEFLERYREIISIICGTILIVFGLHEIGLIHINVLDIEKKLNINLHLNKMSFFKAFLLGFIFSLGWSPCIGPMLANALMLAATESSGYLYIVFYGLGLIIPFLITGLLTSTILNFINKKKNIMKYVLKIAGIIMICFGIYMIGNSSKDIVQIKNRIDDPEKYLMNHEFKDQNGAVICLSDYKGKYVIVNFTTTWCTYCKEEMSDYYEYANSVDDVVCLYVMSTSTSGVSEDELYKYINDNVKLKVIIDENNELFSYNNITSYPTKLVISPEGEMLGIQPGAMSVDTFKSFMDYVKQLTEKTDN